MSIIKLQNAGESVTWTIRKAEVVAGQFGQQVKFENENGDLLFLPHDSASRQLARIPLEVVDCVGETLVISRDPNPKAGAKPYWGIRLAGAAEKQPPSKRLPPPEKQGIAMGRVPAMDDFPDEEYGASVHSPSGPDDDSPYDNPGPIPPFHKPVPHRVAEVAPNAADRMKVAREYLDLLAWVKTQPEVKGMADEAVQATAATIWIQWGRKGLA